MKNTPEYCCPGTRKPHNYDLVYTLSKNSHPFFNRQEVRICRTCLDWHIKNPKNMPLPKPYICLTSAEIYTELHPEPKINEKTREKYEKAIGKSIEKLLKDLEAQETLRKQNCLQISSIAHQLRFERTHSHQC